MKKRKILISWLAFQQDFNAQEKGEDLIVNPSGPNPLIHEFFFDYDLHVILHIDQEESQYKAAFLRTWLQKKHKGHKVEFKKLSLPSKDVINIERIQAKITTELINFRNDHLFLYVTPGTKTMHTAWHIEHLNPDLDTTLIQIREGKHTQSGHPELIKIDFAFDHEPRAAIAREIEISNGIPSDKPIIPAALIPAYQIAEKIALTDKVSCLILGASGTGKEVISKYIHENSSRKEQPFIPINCSAFPDDLLVSELFGYKKGAFTGAESDHIGVFERANGGTILLDEIGDISPKMQKTLLRVLQEKKIRPLKATKDVDIDVRIIAATNKNLVEACKNGEFRWDLYYRLSIVDIHLPPLLEWGEKAIIRLIDHFIEEKKHIQNGIKLNLSKEAIKALQSYHYPGNVRELENLISRLYVVAWPNGESKDLPDQIHSSSITNPLLLESVVSEAERFHIERMLRANDYVKERTAKKIGISTNTLKKRIKDLGIDIPPK
ncbi:MAG: sigma-54-dependent Fis family transcriptional regulator [Bacteroidia bacterium]|nr:sigma-54-dependent Fis family transcriptional regulator [Bacteroidia bacterium]